MARLPKPGQPASAVKVPQWFLNLGFAESPRGGFGVYPATTRTLLDRLLEPNPPFGRAI